MPVRTWHAPLATYESLQDIYRDGTEADLRYEYAHAVAKVEDENEKRRLSCAFEIALEISRLDPVFLESEMKAYYRRMV